MGLFKENIKMKIIAYRNSDKALYEQTLALRDEILRRPLGFSIYDENLSYETGNYFFGAVIDDKLVATVNYFVKVPGVAQLCAFAVCADKQRQGIGRQLVAALFDDLRKKNFTRCIVSARESAVGFYEKFAFTRDEAEVSLQGATGWMMHRDVELTQHKNPISE